MSDKILYPPLTYNTPILCEYDKVISQFNSLITNVNTAMPCKVVAIEKQEQRGVNIVGFVDIQLMIEQTNGQKKAMKLLLFAMSLMLEYKAELMQ